ncbi:MAG: type II toxin-antitoxin system VapC family toxin [Acidimicrobiia bacterium]
MTRFVVDTSAVLHIVSNEIDISESHRLLAPTLLRSQMLSLLHEAVDRGAMTAETALDYLTRYRKIRMRLLGDAVLQRQAWKIADQLGWNSTYDAEYIALTKLQADAFVTLDETLARQVQGIVVTASIHELS